MRQMLLDNVINSGLRSLGHRSTEGLGALFNEDPKLRDVRP